MMALLLMVSLKPCPDNAVHTQNPALVQCGFAFLHSKTRKIQEDREGENTIQ